MVMITIIRTKSINQCLHPSIKNTAKDNCFLQDVPDKSTLSGKTAFCLEESYQAAVINDVRQDICP